MRKRNFLYLFVSTCLFFQCLFGSTTQAQLEENVRGKLWLTVSKNVSVYHILVLLTPSAEGMRPYLDHPLHEKAEAYFNRYKDHPAVAVTDQIFQNYHYFAFNYMAFFYIDFPEARMRDDIVLPPEYVQNPQMQQMMSQYVALVGDFYRSTAFEKFWKDNEEDLRSVMKTCREAMPEFDLPGMMESLYHEQADRFYFVPCPFMKTMGTHVEVQDKQGKMTYYYIAGGNIYEDRFSNISTAFHEFSHSFIEPISAKYAKELSELDYLYKPLEKALAPMGYPNWDRAFNEHIVRAAETHLLRKSLGEEAKDKKIVMEKESGFQLIERFYHHIQTYGDHHDQYPTLEAYYPNLLEDLGQIKVDSILVSGPMGFYPEYRENRLYMKGIVPNSVFESSSVEKGDILYSIEDRKITSEQSFNEAKEERWNRADEGDSVRVCMIRDGKKMFKRIGVPFVTDYRYVINNGGK
jgi:hypothetical protein